MKTTLALCILALSFSSLAGVIAVCENEQTQQTLTITLEDYQTPTWKSILLKWNRKDGRNSFRQFVNAEIKRDDERKLELNQNNMFLGMGQKTSLVLDRKKGTAKLKTKNGGGGIQIGDGPHINTEPSGRQNITFRNCQFN